MYLKSLTLKGFKSFPERTRLEFGPGVSVVVGPNGSGKSNITDAILWALGEQSPLAVRGQAMQDVIFGGGPGVHARSAAEVELVLDNGDGAVDLPLGEISIFRRLDRSGEGEYRMGGARCRLVDVLEALSDTGLGREAHSVVSQGRVESIVTSRPRERRLLIEEAAGLSKHRKRRRRAQLKLERTQENLDRALDVEREARSRLRPLERQARAAELHERLERQAMEARLQLARNAELLAAAALAEASGRASGARAQRGRVEAELSAVMARRAEAERELAERAARVEESARSVYGARVALERLEVRSAQVRSLQRALAGRVADAQARLAAASVESHAPAAAARAEGGPERSEGGPERGEGIAALESELAALEEQYREDLAAQTKTLEAELAAAVAAREQAERELEAARAALARAQDQLEEERGGRIWRDRWTEVRTVLARGVERLLGISAASEREAALAAIVDEAERLARDTVERALGRAGAAEKAVQEAAGALSEHERAHAEAAERERRAQWMIEERRSAAEHGPLAVRRAELHGELAAERRQAERAERERAEAAERMERLRASQATDRELLASAEELLAALEGALEAARDRVGALTVGPEDGRAEGTELAERLRACAGEEAEIQARLHEAVDELTRAEVEAGRAQDKLDEARTLAREIAAALGFAAERAEDEAPTEADGQEATAPLDEEDVKALEERVARLARRREQLGPVNPLAQQEHAEALAHVESLAAQRSDLEAALRELRGVIREADRRIRETFDETYEKVAKAFSEVVGEVFPGGSGRLRLVEEEPAPSMVLGTPAGSGEEDEAAAEADAIAGEEAGDEGALAEERRMGVEIEVTPAGKSAKRLSLLSGGEKSMTALAFLFAVFLARPCPFYVLDEVEAALDDINLERFLALLRRCAGRAQFIVMTHQKRTMDAADWLYGVSMGGDGVSKVLSRRLGSDATEGEATGGEATGAREEGASGAIASNVSELPSARRRMVGAG